MPWLNDLPSARLAREFSSFASYLAMLGELPWKAVWRQIMAYLQVGAMFNFISNVGCLNVIL